MQGGDPDVECAGEGADAVLEVKQARGGRRPVVLDAMTRRPFSRSARTPMKVPFRRAASSIACATVT